MKTENSDMSYFDKFIKKKVKLGVKNILLWIYTRVSSKEQQSNFSLEVQMDEAKKYASQKGFKIEHEFGGTYESASDDFTREEFLRMVTEIRKAKNKPYAICVYHTNRFSRTGGGAIELLNELVFKHNVHLIEISSGLSTETAEGLLAIQKALLASREENLTRLKHTIPGMIKFLEKGNRLGNPPYGYTQYGKRVKDLDRYNEYKQVISINEDGKKLKWGWDMKLEGYRDFEILKKLNRIVLKKPTKQKLSAIWRNPFYCGISVNSLLDKPVHGNWEAMVSEKDFQKVNAMMDGNHQGYKTEKGMRTYL